MKSLVMPIHNEAVYLIETLPNLVNLSIDELVIVLDRCSDNSRKIVEIWSEIPSYKTRIFEKKTASWDHPIAEAWEYALARARGDLIFTTAGDFLVDPSIFHRHEKDITSFSYTTTGGRRLHDRYTNFLNRFLPFVYTCKYGKWSGHFSFKREVWEKIHFKDVRSPDKDFINRCYDAGFSHIYKHSLAIHLRSGNTNRKQFEQGLWRRESNTNPLKVWGHALLELKPYVLKGYYARAQTSEMYY